MILKIIEDGVSMRVPHSRSHIVHKNAPANPFSADENPVVEIELNREQAHGLLALLTIWHQKQKVRA